LSFKLVCFFFSFQIDQKGTILRQMGGILSYFRRDAPIEKVLEEMDGKIRIIEERHLTYRTNWRNWISALLLYSFIFELSYLLFFYLYVYRDESAIIVRVSGDELELAALKAQQKSKLEEFARLTDFYKTRDILNRYAKTLNPPQSPSTTDNKPKKVPITPKTPTPDPTGLRHRHPSTPLPTTPTIPQPIEKPIPPPAPGNPVYMPLPIDHRNWQRTVPKPPVDPNRPWYDKLVDYLVGDDLEQSAPLLCEKCGQNNGLIPKDEMQTIQFKCKFCQHFNEKGSGSVSNTTQIQNPTEEEGETQNQTEIQETQVISEKEEINQEVEEEKEKEEVLEAPNDKKED